MKKSFVLYMSWGPLIENLNPEDAGILFQSIYKYEETGIEPDKDSLIYPIFQMIKATMDEDAVKYEDKKNRIKAAREKVHHCNQTDISLKSVSNQSDISLKSDCNQSDFSSVCTDTDTDTLTDTDTVFKDQDDKHSVNDTQVHFTDEKLNEVFLKYLEARGNTGDAEYTKRKLYDMAKGDVKVMIQILEQSLAQGWKGIFPLKDEKARGPTKNKLKNHEEREYDMSELERELVAKSMAKGVQK